MIDALIDIARTTIIATTIIGRNNSTAITQRGQSQWHIPEGQPRD
jgi:hypothetical protein